MQDITLNGYDMIYHNGPRYNWYDPTQTRTKQDHPYAYSAFFIYGSHETIAGASADYTDRFHLWGYDKFKAAKEVAGIKGDWWNNYSPVQIQRFVDAYYSEGSELVGIVEWCNASNGYPCWSLHIKHPQKAEC